MFKYILLAFVIYFGWKIWRFFNQLKTFNKQNSAKNSSKPKKDLSKLDIKDATFTDIDN